MAKAQPVGPFGERNFTEEELLAEAIDNNLDPVNQPIFLIRKHNLTFRKIYRTMIPWTNKRSALPYRSHIPISRVSATEYCSQDLVIDIPKGSERTLGQADHLGQQSESDDSDESTSEGQYYYKTVKGHTDTKDRINMVGDSFSPFVSVHQAQIGRVEDVVWIMDVKSERGTYVNGVKIEKNQKHILVNGDMVSFGISHLDPKCQLDMGIFWVFKYVEADMEEVNRRANIRSQALGNMVILPNILQYLDFPALKRVREVCRFWREASTPLMKENGEMILSIIRKPNTPKGWAKGFAAKTSAFKSLGFRQLRLVAAGDGLELTLREVKAFLRFFRSAAPQITAVILNFVIEEGNPKHKNRTILLQHLFRECIGMKHLTIKSDLSAGFNNPKYEISGSFKSLKLSSETFKHGFEQLLLAAPALEEIILKSNHVANAFLTYASSHNGLEEKLRLKLQELKALRIIHSHVCGNCQPVDLKLLSHFPLGLQELELNVQNLNKENLGTISRFSKSLKTLVLVDPRTQLHFPEMQALNKIVFVVRSFHFVSPGKLEFSFENGEKGANFPELSQIKVIPLDRFRTGSIFLGTLLNENMDQFPKLETVWQSLYGREKLFKIGN